MPVYAYRARDERGARISGTIEAPNEEMLDESLRARGLYITGIREQRRDARAGTPGASLTLRRRELILLTVHLATVLASGIALPSGLRTFIEDAPSRRLKDAAQALLEGVEGGATLSEAMARLPRVFPEVYVSLVRAGETVGRVDTVLFELVTSLEWQAELTSQVRQASIYPIMLLSALVAVMTLIVTVVMPRFIAALTRVGAEISGPTKVILVFGTLVSEYWLLLILGVAWLVLTLRLLADTGPGRSAFDWLKLRIPVFGPLVQKVGLSRFAHNLGLLHRAGVDFVLALTVVERVVGNVIIARALGEARRRVVAGSSLADALRATGEFPPLVLQMVATGEASGNLEEMLGKVSQYYDREVPAAVRRITTVLEPVVYIILGAFVLGVALSLYSPIFSMIEKLRVRPRF